MPKDNLDKTIKDAQAFIDSMKEFNKTSIGEDSYEPNTSKSNPAGSNPSGSIDSPFQSDLNNTIDEEKDRFGLSGLSSFSLNPGPSNNRRLAPVGKNGFQTHKFSPDLPLRADVITFIEVYYYENKKLPLIHELHEHFSDHKERPNFLKGWNAILDEISESLSNRGIKPYNTVDNYVDPKFAWATSLIVNHLDKRTIPAKLKEAGLSTKEWQAFLRRKRHYDYFQARLDEVFTQDVKNDAKIALSRAIQNGDLQAIKYYNELQNIYRPETQNAMQMVSIVLTAVMEILAVHVKPEVLNTVAAEIRTSPSVRKIIEAQAS